MIHCTFEHGHQAQLRHVTVDALVIRDNQMLLIRRSSSAPVEAGKLALPGGFLDRDESAAQAVCRELLEETGYQATKVRLFRIIDEPRLKGDDRQNVGFFFEVSVGKQIQEPDDEVSEVVWMAAAELTAKAIGFDHFDTIQLYLKHLQEPYQLPIMNSAL